MSSHYLVQRTPSTDPWSLPLGLAGCDLVTCADPVAVYNAKDTLEGHSPEKLHVFGDGSGYLERNSDRRAAPNGYPVVESLDASAVTAWLAENGY